MVCISSTWSLRLFRTGSLRRPITLPKMHSRSIADAAVRPPLGTTVCPRAQRISSRRILEERRNKIKSPPGGDGKSSTESAGGATAKKDESQWPRSVRIAGYAALALSVPASICTAIAEHPSIRDALEGDRPHDPKDSAMGKKVVALVRKYWTEDGRTFPAEDSEDVRETQVEIARTVDRPIGIVASVSGFPCEEVVDVQAPAVGVVHGATLIGDTDRIMDELGTGKRGHSHGPLLVDFSEEVVDAYDNGGDAGSIMTMDKDTFSISEEMDDKEQIQTTSAGAVTGKKIRELTHSFSAWHHFDKASVVHGQGGGGGGNGVGEMTPEEIRLSELEWREAQLQQQLIDPYCTRDIDEMQEEIAQVQKELRKIRGWRWKPW